MKKLLGLFFCFGFLLLGGLTQTHANPTIQYQPGYSVNDVGKMQVSAPANYTLIKEVPQHVVAKIDIPAFNKQMYAKDALISQYKFIPYCPIVFLGKHKTKYITQYTYKYIESYNQPPSILR